MRRFVAFFVICLVVVLSGLGNADVESDLAEAIIDYGSYHLHFLYPSECRFVDEGSLGSFIYLTDMDYIVMDITKQNLSGVKALHKYIIEEEKIVALSDDLHVFASRGDPSPVMPTWDIVEAGINLPNGTALVMTVYCHSGDIKIYDIASTILGSIIDTEKFDEWLYQDWVPYAAKPHT